MFRRRQARSFGATLLNNAPATTTTTASTIAPTTTTAPTLSSLTNAADVQATLARLASPGRERNALLVDLGVEVIRTPPHVRCVSTVVIVVVVVVVASARRRRACARRTQRAARTGCDVVACVHVVSEPELVFDSRSLRDCLISASISFKVSTRAMSQTLEFVTTSPASRYPMSSRWWGVTIDFVRRFVVVIFVSFALN